MTGRELIIYILQNGLEDVEVFKGGRIPGYMTIDEAAIRTHFGRATIEAWIDAGLLDGVMYIGKELLIPEASVLKAVGNI